MKGCTNSGPATSLACINCACRSCAVILQRRGWGRCRKKTVVRSKADRGPWNPIESSMIYVSALDDNMNMNGSSVDAMCENANSVVSSGPGACGTPERHRVAQQRAASCPGSRGFGAAAVVATRRVNGPERLVFDKSSATGIRSRGGLEHVQKGVSTASATHPLLADALQGLNRTREDANTEDDRPNDDTQEVRTTPRSVGPTLLVSGFMRPSSSGASKRSHLRDVGCGRMVGPERLFYDKSSNTGSHANGPSFVAKGKCASVDQSWRRSD
jgi:hypothetical protein